MTSQDLGEVALEQKTQTQTQPVPSSDTMALDMNIDGTSTRDETLHENESSDVSVLKPAPAPVLPTDSVLEEVGAVKGLANVDEFASDQAVDAPTNSSLASQPESSPTLSQLPPRNITMELQPTTSTEAAQLESASQMDSVSAAIEAAIDDAAAPTGVPPIIEVQQSDLRHTSPLESTQTTEDVAAEPTQPTQEGLPDRDFDLDGAQLPTPQPEKESEVAGISANLSDSTSARPETLPERPVAPHATSPPSVADHSTIVHEQATPPETMVEPNDTEMLDAPLPLSAKIAREREEDDADAMEPSAKRTKTEDESFTAHNGEGSEQVSQQAIGTPISEYQVQVLSKAISTIVKTKHGINFKSPVLELWPALKGNYDMKIERPIDLRTMNSKLVNHKYPFMESFTADLHLLYHNSESFNGPIHDVTQAASLVRKSLLEKVANTPTEPYKPPKKEKKSKPKRPSPAPDTASRSHKAAPRDNGASQATSSAPSTYALDPGTNLPIIRRDSTMENGDRPKRRIMPPKSKDLVYQPVRSKNKKASTELKFCEEVLREVRKDKHASVNAAFQTPVDPVALNIPTYFTVIKKPMDLSTMDSKLKSGAYSNANEFEKDMRLMITNCLKFNPPGNVVHNIGRAMERLFDEQWSRKDQWIQEHTPAAYSPTSQSSDEGEDDDEDEEAQMNGGKDSLAAAKELLLEHQTKLITLMSAKNPDSFVISMQQDLVATVQKRVVAEYAEAEKRKTKKGKTAKAPKKAAPPPKKPSNSKKPGGRPKYLGTLEKEVISAGMMDLPEQLSLSVLEDIRREQPQLESGEDGTLELDIDVISQPLLWKIYNLVMEHNPEVEKAVKATMQQRESPRVVAKPPPRPKKNKPMSKIDQERNIKALQQKLGTYERASSGSHSQEPVMQSTEHQTESSGDEPSDSEEE
ncbi:transcription regulator [Diplocarpon rosae]|nr:transcription regulator [Diplocarpon rosae]